MHRTAAAIAALAVGARAATSAAAPVLPIMAPQAIMLPRAHGTCVAPVQKDLRWGADRTKADHICCFNRHYAEEHGYWEQTPVLREMYSNWPEPTTFYDSVTGKALFVAPIDRTVEEFARESSAHGWPSFRDAEVVWENVRVVGQAAQGETVSVDGTHLGHNLPDGKGNRYCINLVSVAGRRCDESAKGGASCAAKL